MFQKVLIAEDQSSIHQGLEKTLGDLSIKEVDMAQYCDDALLKIKAALKNNHPFELLITDLSFKEDHRQRTLTSGEALIEAVQKIQPELKIIVFSVEHRIGKIRTLLDGYKVDGYVEKGREESKDIQKAIATILNGNVYSSHGITQMLRSSDDLTETDEYDTLMLQLLAKGMQQPQIADYFKERNLPASSLSSIEKRLNKLKVLFNAKNPTQLVATAIDRGII